MHVIAIAIYTVLIKHLHYYKLNIILKNKATNLVEQQFHSDLGVYHLHRMKLKNGMFKLSVY